MSDGSNQYSIKAINRQINLCQRNQSIEQYQASPEAEQEMAGPDKVMDRGRSASFSLQKNKKSRRRMSFFGQQNEKKLKKNMNNKELHDIMNAEAYERNNSQAMKINSGLVHH